MASKNKLAVAGYKPIEIPERKLYSAAHSTIRHYYLAISSARDARPGNRKLESCCHSLFSALRVLDDLLDDSSASATSTMQKVATLK